MKSSRRRYVCPTPRAECSGAPTIVDSHGRTIKAHGSHGAAFDCYVAWLRTQGYIRKSTREFYAPNGGPILVLTKKRRFGGAIRGGKRGTTSDSKRFNVPGIKGSVGRALIVSS